MHEDPGSSGHRPRALGAVALLGVVAYLVMTRDPIVFAMVLAEIARATLAAHLATRSRGKPSSSHDDVPPTPIYPTEPPHTVIHITHRIETLSITIERTPPRR
ncbi:hypothetical protein [Frankia tisae]|uniref:hypothetical protein n=1 Tax=Frankia tisae TaxID=2950104 RepID=UPI0021C1983F|nr:hypothetical protein [Frankia tisae]